MAVNINGDTGIDKVQPGTIDSADFGPGVITAPAIASGAVTSAKLDTNLSIPGTMTATSFSGDGSSLTGIAGGFSNMQVFTSPGTWTNPGNITKVKVTVTGGGGGARGEALADEGAVGGAAGGTAIEIIPFPSATNVPITIGSGGNGVGAPVDTAPSGGTSSFGAYCSATGGAGGSKSTGVMPGGIGSGGDINLRGQPASKPNGGGSYFGGAGQGAIFRNPGGPGNTGVAGILGGGGGGSLSTTPSPSTGAAGGAGVVVVEY